MLAYETYENLLFDRVGTDGRVGRITLNRPEKLNALSQELLYEFNDLLHDVEADDSVRVLIVRGAGRAFSSGYDLTPTGGRGADAVVRRYRGQDEEGRRLFMGTRTGMQQITDIYLYFWNMAKVTVAQLHGYALAGGCEMAMMADIVVAAEDCRIGHPGVRFGTSRTGVIWPLLIGMRKAKELYYTGDNVSGVEAAEMGMINHAFAAEQLDERAVALADHVANMPSDHLAMLKLNMNRFYENMGIYSSVRSSVDIDAVGQSSQNYEWRDRMQRDGLREALAWRDGPYQDYSQAGRS